MAFLQKFSEDEFMRILFPRINDSEIEALVGHLTGLMKRHLSEAEYHKYFLKD
jgi:hypothetical protein